MKKLEGFYAGIDFGGWFSQCDYSQDRLDNFIKPEDFTAVKSWGFDHVRIPVDYNILQNPDGSFIESGFERIEKAILCCRDNGLNMILDLHKTMGFSFDDGEQESGLFENEKYQNLFYSLWVEFAKRYSKYSKFLAFELLNEITEKKYMDKWNEMASKTIRIIREYSEDIKILIGGYYNNSAEAVPDIRVPVDGNIVFNFHCYEPLVFTHQGAYWIKTMKPDFRMKYREKFSEYLKNTEQVLPDFLSQTQEFGDDEIPDKDYFMVRFRDAVKAAEKRDAYLYCGEYGVIELADLDSTLEWYTDIHAAFSEYGIGHALWSYREMDFDFAGERMSPVRERIIESSKL